MAAPLTVTVPVPVSVLLPVWVRKPTVGVKPLRFSVPELMLRVLPRFVSVPLKMAVPPLTVVVPVTLY